MANSRRHKAKDLQRMCAEGPGFSFLGGKMAQHHRSVAGGIADQLPAGILPEVAP